MLKYTILIIQYIHLVFKKPLYKEEPGNLSRLNAHTVLCLRLWTDWYKKMFNCGLIVLGVPYISANTYCKSCNLPKPDIQYLKQYQTGMFILLKQCYYCANFSPNFASHGPIGHFQPFQWRRSSSWACFWPATSSTRSPIWPTQSFLIASFSSGMLVMDWL